MGRPKTLDLIRDRPVERFEVELDDCVAGMAFSFADDGWHPYRAALVEYEQDPAIAPLDSIIARFAARWTPRRISEVLPHDGPRPRFDGPFGRWPWGEFPLVPGVDGYGPGGRLRSPLLGPTPAERIVDDHRRLVELLGSLTRVGYQPEGEGRGLVTGCWLERSDGRRRFRIIDGNHRVAILAHLGHERVMMCSDPVWHTRISETELASWPFVASGECPPDEALLYLDAFFERTGRRLAERLGLTP